MVLLNRTHLAEAAAVGTLHAVTGSPARGMREARCGARPAETGADGTMRRKMASLTNGMDHPSPV
ncbi:hypothetical protein ACFQ11_29185 [Actinomadura sediminis]|uniref:Uncharacterized protein n=1 Tax=Actinomadura sediminis TaxID=1038904 RepID=A0ABW3EVK5_9ACTN